MPRNWFSTDSFDELHIFAPEALARQNVDALPALVVRDRAFIQRLVERIESIDPEGDLMKKPGPNTEVLRIVFCTSGEPEEGIEFFNGSIKTPSTGFHSSNPSESAAIYEDLLGLMNPDVGNVLSIVIDTALSFPAFTFHARGARAQGPGSGPPRTAGGQTNLFEVSFDDHSLVLEVYSGQTPPAPREFSVRGATYTLFTYQTPAGERLHPHRFMIVSS